MEIDTQESTRDTVIRELSMRSGRDRSDVERAKSFAELGLDSLDVIDVILAVEEKFDIRLGPPSPSVSTSPLDGLVSLIEQSRSCMAAGNDAAAPSRH